MKFEGRNGSGAARLIRVTGQRLLLIASACVAGACSSGGSGGGSPPPPPTVNQAPVANAGADQSVAELSVVNLSGSASDPNDAVGTLTVAWTQTGGVAVTLNNANSLAASFTAPDVAAGSPEVLTFQLAVTDPGGLSASDTVSVTVQELAGMVTISGKAEYEFVPPVTVPFMCDGLDFASATARPIRGATVQLLNAAGTTVLDTGVTDAAGNYSFVVAASTDVMIRVRAELVRGGAPSWNVQVRNNVVDPGSDTVDPGAPPLTQRPMYVLDTAPFNSGGVSQVRPTILATTGWNIALSRYDGTRSAAPFAVLDAIYSAMQMLLTVEPLLAFAPLDAYWSPDNDGDPRVGTTDDWLASGNLGGVSFYFSGTTENGTVIPPSLFLLGRDGDDTEEFDDHVIVHEWGHYFEDVLSRSDSIGGSHGVGDLLDARVAFGEGWATALSGIALGNPSYCDTLWAGVPKRLRGFELNTENEPPGSADGWFNEISVMKLIYDLWDTNSDIAADSGSVGFAAIYDVMTGPQSVTPAFTSIFSFASELKAVSGQDAFIDGLLTAYGINPSGIDAFGTTEDNDSGGGAPVDDVLPVYTDITLGVPETICVNSQFDTGRDGNKLSEHRYLRLQLGSSRQLTYAMNTLNPPSTPAPGFDCAAAYAANPDDPAVHTHSDPDFYLWRGGSLLWVGGSCDPNAETGQTQTLSPGTYVIDLNDYRHEDEDTVGPYPDQVCFEFTLQ